jgi:hypothetical protein
LLIVVIVPQVLTAQRSIPDDNLAYPIQAQLTNCINNIPSIQGSGFFLATGTKMYLVTARHILYNQSQVVQPGQSRELLCKTAELFSHSKDPADTELNHLQLNLQQLSDNGAIKAHASHDVVVVDLGTNTANMFYPNPSVKGVHASPNGVLSVKLENVKKLNQVLTANDVYILGYPASVGIQQQPQIDYGSPLLRKGIVAGINKVKGTIVLDAMVFQGNSGGPAVEVEHVGFQSHFTIIGVISEYVPIAETWINATFSYSNVQIHNSGYSIIEPMDAVLELIGK